MKTLFKALAPVVAMSLVALAPGQPPPKPMAGEPDRVKLAQVLVNQCAGIHHGDLVLLTGGARDLDLLENLAVEVRKLGAHALLTTQSEGLVRRMYTDVPAKFDAQEPAFIMKLAEIMDAWIYVDFYERPDLLADIPPQRQIEHDRAFLKVNEKLIKRGVRQVYLGNGLYPTKARAAQFRVSQDELSRIFWNGVNADYTQLQATGEKVQNALAGGDELKITAPNGTNLTVKITQRPVFVSDGLISTKDRRGGSPACQVWLPAGEVYLTPVPGTANGTFIADTHFFEGQAIEGLKFEFKNGRLTKMTAAGDITVLKKHYDAAPEGRDVFAFVDIGINPNVEVPKGSRMVTWMAAGTISVGAGGNTWAGGDNEVPFMVWSHLHGGTLTVDGRPIVEKGKLAVGR